MRLISFKILDLKGLGVSDFRKFESNLFHSIMAMETFFYTSVFSEGTLTLALDKFFPELSSNGFPHLFYIV